MPAQRGRVSVCARRLHQLQVSQGLLPHQAPVRARTDEPQNRQIVSLANATGRDINRWRQQYPDRTRRGPSSVQSVRSCRCWSNQEIIDNLPFDWPRDTPPRINSFWEYDVEGRWELYLDTPMVRSGCLSVESS